MQACRACYGWRRGVTIEAATVGQGTRRSASSATQGARVEEDPEDPTRLRRGPGIPDQAEEPASGPRLGRAAGGRGGRSAQEGEVPLLLWFAADPGRAGSGGGRAGGGSGGPGAWDGLREGSKEGICRVGGGGKSKREEREVGCTSAVGDRGTRSLRRAPPLKLAPSPESECCCAGALLEFRGGKVRGRGNAPTT